MKDRWKDIPGFEGHYQVSTLGRVRSLPRFYYRRHRSGTRVKLRLRGRILKLIIDPELGYAKVNLYVKGKMFPRHVHFLVLRTFRGKRPIGKHGRHLNTIGTDNRLLNLRWSTPRANIRDHARTGKRKLTYDQADNIRQLARQGVPRKTLCKKFHACLSVVAAIVRKEIYVR